MSSCAGIFGIILFSSIERERARDRARARIKYSNILMFLFLSLFLFFSKLVSLLASLVGNTNLEARMEIQGCSMVKDARYRSQVFTIEACKHAVLVDFLFW